MIEDFIRALARVQSDYSFYVGCQTDATAALRDYSLSPDERQTLLDPERLASALEEGVRDNKPREWRVTFSGRHDWINTTKPNRLGMADEAAERDAKVA